MALLVRVCYNVDMKETIKDEVVDNYKEHSQHFTYDEHCSECFKNVKEFDEK